jgi:hypothetical protein
METDDWVVEVTGPYNVHHQVTLARMSARRAAGYALLDAQRRYLVIAGPGWTVTCRLKGKGRAGETWNFRSSPDGTLDDETATVRPYP